MIYRRFSGNADEHQQFFVLFIDFHNNVMKKIHVPYTNQVLTNYRRLKMFKRLKPITLSSPSH